MSQTLSNTFKREHLCLPALFILLLFTFAASSASAYADDPLMQGENTCWDGSTEGSGKSTAGKPVNLFTGSETLLRTDLTVGNLYPIQIQRRYNSTSAYDSPLGYGWAHNYDKRLYTYADPEGSVIIRKGCGQKLRFTCSSSACTPPAGDDGALVQNTDGTYTYTERNGSKENYDIYGRIASAVDAQGNSLVFTYVDDYRKPLTGILLSNLNLTNPIIVSYDYRLWKIEEMEKGQATARSSITFNYDMGTGRLLSITDNTGNISVSYSHDTIGNLTSVNGTSASGTYGYTSSVNSHSLTNIDEGKGEYVNEYDTQGRVKKQEHGLRIIDIDYLPNQTTKVTTTVKDQGNTILNVGTRIVAFNSSGLVIQNIDALGNVNNYSRNDPSSKITREEYWQNIGTVDTPNLILKSATDYIYDTYGNIKTKIEASHPDADWDAIKKTTTYIYYYEIYPSAPAATFHTLYQEIVKSVVNPTSDTVITYNHDNANGNLLTMVETGLLGDGTQYTYTTTYDYYTDGKLKSIDGPRTAPVEDKTTYYYAPTTGYLNGIERPLAGTTTYTNHDFFGNPQTVTDPNLNVTAYTYDDHGRVKTMTAPGDTAATQYFYLLGGSCGSSCSGANKYDYIVLPEGNIINYDYDLYGNLIKISDNLSNSINYTYDSEGNKLTEDIRDTSGALRKSLSFRYDALNRLKKIINPDTSYTEYSYDFRGNKSAIRNPNSAITSYEYDALNRLAAVHQPGNVDTIYGYDTNNNLTSVTDSNSHTTSYKMDDRGKVFQVISPDTGTTTYQYDPAGNMISKTDAKGVTISYVYDALNRLTKIDFPTVTDIVYVYDNCVNGKGRLCSMTDASGTTVYEYSAKGQIKKETKTIDSIQYVTQYTYDQNGNLKTMTYPSGRVITYTLTNDRATSVLNNASNLATNIAYKPFGGMTSLTYGNGLAGGIGHDNQYRITGIQAGTILNLNYNLYDANGNIKSILNTLDPTKNKSFDYDSLDRLSTADGPWGSLGWTYDGVGNRLTENANTYTYPSNNNKLTSANGISFGYDNNGNTTTEGARQYVYNQNQRLIQVNDGSTTATYSYNGNGQRVKKVVNGTVTIFHYSLNGQIIAESDSSGNITAEYVYLNGQPLAKMEGTNTYYYHNDHLGTPQKMTDSAGVVRWSADYKPFGEATIDQAVTTITNNLRFPGQYFDSETGLHYNYYRDYNPVIGRYAESDPIGIIPNGPRGGLNHLYVYTSNNPVNATDPTGLRTFRCRAPLHALGGSGTRSGPDIPGNPLYHEYLCVYNSSSAACVGQDRSGGPWSPGQPSRDPFNTDRCDQVEPDNACIENCVLSAGNSPRPSYGLCGPGTNCQEWVSATLSSCREQCRCRR